MATAVNTLIDSAEEILQDPSNDKWSAAELLAWLNYGQWAVVREKPDAYPVRSVIALASTNGGLWQTFPAASILLLDVLCNCSSDGSTKGAPVTVVDRKWIDTAVPDWTTATATTTIKHIIYDPKTQPKAFMVYPPAAASSYIEVVTADLPAAASAGGNITLDDEYAEMLLDYILFRAYSRDADYAANSEKAIAHYQNFLMLLGKLNTSEIDLHPKKRQGGD